MGFFGRYFSGLLGKKQRPEKRSGDMRTATGAGPALAAHSKDAKSDAPADRATPRVTQTRNSRRHGHKV